MISNIEQNSGGKSGARSEAAADEGDFRKIVDLLADYTQAENQLADLENAANEEFLVTVNGLRTKYAKLQQKLIEFETALEVLSRKHPEWFQDKKTIKTPYGSVQLKNNPPKIVADNAELSIVLIKQDDERIPKTINNEANPEAVDASKLIHSEEKLNLEALAGCTDGQLKKWRLRREQSDTFTVKAAKLDLGKAVKESAAKESK